jgi:hypothetical protein
VFVIYYTRKLLASFRAFTCLFQKKSLSLQRRLGCLAITAGGLSDKEDVFEQRIAPTPFLCTKENMTTNKIKMIHIGSLIEQELRRQERSVARFARKLHCDPSNVYKIFKKQSIDTQLLENISSILQHNFFLYYSNKV